MKQILKVIGNAMFFFSCMGLALILLAVAINEAEPPKVAEIPRKLDKESAMKICNNVRLVLDNRGRGISCKYSPSKSINAHANAKEVVIYQGMIDFVKSEGELAVVIGHEFSHHLLGHVELGKMFGGPYGIRKGTFVDHQYFEAMADLLGMQLATMAGYNACKGKDLWARMVKHYGHDYFGNPTHPNTLARIHNFETLCKVSYPRLMSETTDHD